MKGKILLVLAGLLIGCAAGAVGVGVGVAGAEGYAPNPEAQRRQQLCDAVDGLDDLNAKVTRRGGEGWELVALHAFSEMADTRHVVCFRRPARGGPAGAAAVMYHGRP